MTFWHILFLTNLPLIENRNFNIKTCKLYFPIFYPPVITYLITIFVKFGIDVSNSTSNLCYTHVNIDQGNGCVFTCRICRWFLESHLIKNSLKTTELIIFHITLTRNICLFLIFSSFEHNLITSFHICVWLFIINFSRRTSNIHNSANIRFHFTKCNSSSD